MKQTERYLENQSKRFQEGDRYSVYLQPGEIKYYDSYEAAERVQQETDGDMKEID